MGRTTHYYLNSNFWSTPNSQKKKTNKNQWEEPFHIYKGQWRLKRETAYDMRKWRVRRLGTLPSSATYNMFDELHWILYRKRHRGNNNRNLASSSSGIWTALSFPFFPSLPSYDIIQKKDKASSCFSSATGVVLLGAGIMGAGVNWIAGFSNRACAVANNPVMNKDSNKTNALPQP